MRPANLTVSMPAATAARDPDRRVELVAGVDGCPAGWVVAVTGVDPATPVTVSVVATIDGIVADLRAGRLCTLAIDMPIGLTIDGVRAADRAARALLGPRRSSLFPTPAHDVLHATDFADALARSRAATGKGISKQAFNLLPKMRALAAAIDPLLQPRLSEVHPETSFAVLRGAPCAFPKRSFDGATERRAALLPHFDTLDDALAVAPRGARADDVLDALVAAWTARRMARGDALVLGDVDARDPRGYRVTITA